MVSSKKPLLTDEATFMAGYLAKKDSCTSWDFEADYDFASKFGTQEEKSLIHDAMCSCAPWSHIIAAWENGWKKSITDRRLKALRELVNNGFARSSWVELGAGAMNTFGRSRVRGYWNLGQPDN